MKAGYLMLTCLLAFLVASCESGEEKRQNLFPRGEGKPLPESAELLASNTVTARYMQTVDQPCRFMTALCPDRCDHATRLAQFKVISNKHYERTGKYGDERLAPGDIAVVDVQKEILGQSPQVAELISRLKPGNVVKLTLNHYYVHLGQGQFPVRPVVRIARVIKHSS